MNPEVLESLDETKEELKRADHLLFVSLKYTRTVDVIKNVLNRLVSVYEKGVDTLLDLALEEKKLSKVPVAVNLKAKAVLEVYASRELESFINFYLMLRRINRSFFERREEYRRHVAMVVYLDDMNVVEIGTDELYEFFRKTTEFIELLEEFIYDSN